MIDQPRSPVPKKPEPHRSDPIPNNTARNGNDGKHSPAGQVDVTAMVRSLQRTAGMTDCFRKGNVDCDEIDCDWRVYCLDTPAERLKNGKWPPTK